MDSTYIISHIVQFVATLATIVIGCLILNGQLKINKHQRYIRKKLEEHIRYHTLNGTAKNITDLMWGIGQEEEESEHEK
jgi:hypothetical protein